VATLELLSVIFATVVGGIANRFRGGGVFALPGETPTNTRSQVRRITFAVLFGLLAWNPWVAVIAFLSVLTGWGFPVSAAIRRNPTIYQDECWPLDKASLWIVNRIYRKYRPQPYGVIWLTLHGLITGALVGVGFAMPFAVDAGMAAHTLGYGFLEAIWVGLQAIPDAFLFTPLLMAGMGFAYSLTGDWEKGEIADGILKGLALGLAVLLGI